MRKRASAIRENESERTNRKKAQSNNIITRYFNFRNSGDYAAALVEARETEESVEVHPPGGVKGALGYARRLVADIYRLQGQDEQAGTIYQRALTSFEDDLGSKPHHEKTNILYGLALLSVKQGRWADAEMLAYSEDPSDPRDAYPAYWAPFVVVGEGAAR